MSKTVLLFGANGFVGKALHEYFNKKKDIRLVIATRAECDLLKFREVSRYIRSIKIDYIINAAYIEVNSNVKPTKKYLRNNLMIPHNILKACAFRKDIQQIIFFGSGLEYGDSKEEINEKHSLNPKNYYAYTKTICSKESIKLARSYDLPLVIIKAFNLYGPFDKKSVLYYVIKSVIEKKEISITAGEQMRDFLYIEDLARLVEKVINKKEAIKKCTIFNAGSGKGILLKEAIQKIFTVMNFNGSTKIRPYRNNEYFYQIADIQKAKKVLNWKPEVLFDEGIKRTIAWIKRLED